MATRTDEPLTIHGGLEGDDARKASRLREDIAETRSHMARTASAIEERLSPKNIKAQVASVKSHLLDEVSSTKTKLLEEIKDAKSTLKGEFQSELGAAKAKVREKTIGRVENMVQGARTTMTHAGSAVSSGIDTVKTNPIPAALVAVGLGWLIVSSMRGKKKPTYDSRIGASSVDGVDEDGYAYSYDQDVARENVARSRGSRRVIERGRRVVESVGTTIGANVSSFGSNVSNVGHEVADKAKGVAYSVADKAEHLAHDAGALAHDASHRVEDAAGQARRKVGMVARNAGVKGGRIVRNAGTQARRAEQGFERQLRSNPIAFGAIAVAVGAAIGLLLPSTEVENRLVGEQKDRLFDTAKERFEGFAQQAIATVQEKAGEVTSQLKNVEPSSPQQGYQNGLSSQANGLSNGVSKHL